MMGLRRNFAITAFLILMGVLILALLRLETQFEWVNSQAQKASWTIRLHNLSN